MFSLFKVLEYIIIYYVLHWLYHFIERVITNGKSMYDSYYYLCYNINDIRNDIREMKNNTLLDHKIKNNECLDDHDNYDNYYYSEKEYDDASVSTSVLDTPNNEIIKSNDGSELIIEDKNDVNNLILKRDILIKLGELKNIGIKLSQEYDINSDLKMMQNEYNLQYGLMRRNDSVKRAKEAIYLITNLIETFKPLKLLNIDLNLKNLTQRFAENDTFDNVLKELYPKYLEPNKEFSPEIRLIIIYIVTMMMTHYSNTLFKNQNTHDVNELTKKL